MLNIEFAAAKVNKYASRESGDTVELVERPTSPGGFTIILADGQGTGRSAKTLSNMVTGRCISMVKDGIRDGAVARGANDYLFAYKHGQVSATLNLISTDLISRTLVISRNNPEPVFLLEIKTGEPGEEPGKIPRELFTLNEESIPLGIYPRTKPVIKEFGLKPGLVVVAFSDGIGNAGTRFENLIDLPALLKEVSLETLLGAQALADAILARAISRDRGRPQDDMSVVVVSIKSFQAEDGAPVPRRLAVNFPFQL